MKKWIIFLSISCALLLFIFAVQCEDIRRILSTWKQLHNEAHMTYADIFEFYYENGFLSYWICTAIATLFNLLLIIAHFFLLITIAMRKITPMSVKENLAAWKAHSDEKKALRKQRKLEKAQAKVTQLQNDIQKDDE